MENQTVQPEVSVNVNAEPVNQEVSVQNDKLYTQEEVDRLLAEAMQKAQAKPAKPVAKKDEERLASRAIAALDRWTHKGLVVTHDVALPVNIYLADNFVPNVLEHVGNGAEKAESTLKALKERSRAKAVALRPVSNETPQQKAAAFQAKLAKLVASDPEAAAAYQAMAPVQA